jgi:cytochrome c oxidase assembly protein subunit 15
MPIFSAPIFSDSIPPQRRALIIWLYSCCFMVFAMAVIGAITRLTESGLSMVEWRPLIGALPPLGEAEWQRVFALYQQTPEYIQKHSWMEIDDFKYIFFWEWFHRFWGRLIGLVYVLPLAYFWATKQIPKGYGWPFIGLLTLGGLQGVIGWWMVKSGLIDRPDVSHYRLAVHLSMAFILFCLLFWAARSLTFERRVSDLAPRGVRRMGWVAFGLLSITIVWGAFVAGLEAGMIYNTWPLMNGTLTPPEAFSLDAVINEHAWVQFSHRWVAIIAGLALIGFAIVRRAPYLGIMVLLQIALGIFALLSQLWIPMAAAHQAGALILLALMTNQLHALYYVHRK